MFVRLLIGAAITAAAAAGQSEAALLDLTNRSVFNGAPASGAWIMNVDGSGTNVYVESTGGATNTNENGPNASRCPSSYGLSCQSDGIGINDDEITHGTRESVTLTFSESVNLVSVAFLDLFKRRHNSTNSADIEKAVTEIWQADGFGGFNLASTLTTWAETHNGAGFATETLGSPMRVDRLVFRSTEGRDDQSSDFALAGLKFEQAGMPMPIPGAMPLFLAASFGFAAARRRRAQA